MPEPYDLRELLASKGEPSHGDYTQSIEKFASNPEWESMPGWNEDREIILMYLLSHSGRISHFLRRLRVYQRDSRDGLTKDKIVAKTTQLLLDIIPPSIDILSLTSVVDLLVPGLDICFSTRSVPKALLELATAIARSDRLLQLVVSDPAGNQIFRKWIQLFKTTNHQAKTLRKWTACLSDLASRCTRDHGVSADLKRWEKLFHLTGELRTRQNAQENISRQTSTRDLRILGSGERFETTSFGDLEDNLVASLQEIGLEIPHSDRLLSHVIEQLEGDKTIAILVSIAQKYPCKLCYENVQTPFPRRTESPTATGEVALDESSPIIHSELLGQAIGSWNVLISATALRSLQNLSSSGSLATTWNVSQYSLTRLLSGCSKTVNEKLIDIASGCAKTKLAGTTAQRARLKVPLALTKCGRGTSILWQVDIGTDDAVVQQLIKGQSSWINELSVSAD